MATGQCRHLPCVVPCGGSSSRLELGENKCLVEINGKPILGHVIEFWQSRHIESFILIVCGESASAISEYVKSVCNNPVILDRGNIVNLVKAIELAEPHIEDRFILALGDCLNFGRFLQKYPPLGVGICIASPYELAKNYLVHLDGQEVAKLVEKPHSPTGLCGMGTLFLDRRIFSYIRRLKLENKATSIDLIGALQLAMGQGEVIEPVFFSGNHINITYPDDLTTAKRLAQDYNSNQESKVEVLQG